MRALIHVAVFSVFSFWVNLGHAEVLFTSLELGGIERPVNLCLVDQVKKQFPPAPDEVVVDRGFAFRGRFPTHPLYMDVPILFVMYFVPVADSPNEIKVTRDIHVAVPSFNRSGWSPVATPGTSVYTHVQGATDGQIFFSAVDAKNSAFDKAFSVNAAHCFKN